MLVGAYTACNFEAFHELYRIQGEKEEELEEVKATDQL